MTNIEKIDYMIQTLQLAKEELELAEMYFDEKEKDKDFYNYGHMGSNDRMPNGTLIRENIKTVGRMAGMVANNIVLTSYCNRLYKE